MKKLEIKINVPPDDKEFVVRQLISEPGSNKKLLKSDNSNADFLSIGLSLAPSMSSGYQTCPNASPGCVKSCIFTAGNGLYPIVNLARTAKTIAFFERRKEFVEMLKRDLKKYQKLAEKRSMRLACRLNVFSDIMWEKIVPSLFTDFPSIQFYDYTKNPTRMMRYLKYDAALFPANYHLTFSRSEYNEKECLNVLKNMGNVAVVFGISPKKWDKERPKKWNGFRVLNGDLNDLRFLDPLPCVVGLYAKGTGRKDQTNFVLRIPLL